MPDSWSAIEEIGPGYCYAPVFGHWDITHALFDSIPVEPQHVLNQFHNILAQQQPDGMMPGLIRLLGAGAGFSKTVTHPPVWPYGIEAYLKANGELPILGQCLDALVRQIGWFESARRADDGGFYYRDIDGDRCFESGIDDGIRFIECPPYKASLVDATAHVYALYDFAAQWAARLGRLAGSFTRRAEELRAVIRTELWDRESGFFYDSWMIKDPAKRVGAFEGMWPVVVGAATPEQAARVIDGHLLNPRRFFAAHPIATVAQDDPRFELRMWRGPAWNSMTHWAALGCLRYGRPDAARRILEAALDSAAAQYARAGAIWEFYHPHGDAPDKCKRKSYTPYNAPCINYLGHNPLVAMARLWQHAASG